jgi:deoxyribonuclease V
MNIILDKMTPKLESQTIKLQKELSKKVISKNCFPKKIKTVCGVDVSYNEKRAFCSAIVLDFNTMNIIETARISKKISYPYIPGLFMLRESEPILEALNKLETNFDILLIDGHGRLHPRLCGLACFIGIKTKKPTIGIAKKILCGKVKTDSTVKFDGKILGFEIKNNNKKIYVSVGHKINLKTGTRIAKKLILDKMWYPEPLRLADSDCKLFRKQFKNSI